MRWSVKDDRWLYMDLRQLVERDGKFLNLEEREACCYHKLSPNLTGVFLSCVEIYVKCDYSLDDF
jgi:hypothetical protein